MPYLTWNKGLEKNKRLEKVQFDQAEKSIIWGANREKVQMFCSWSETDDAMNLAHQLANSGFRNPWIFESCACPGWSLGREKSFVLFFK